MPLSWTRLPFAARNRAEFSQGLTAWLGEVFYDILPARGFETREEQIYTSFQMARAFADGDTLFAEAGAGTGKTFAYLLPAVCYARFQGQPVVVASATPTLQAQLLGPHGDIATLSRLLGLDVDARLAADPSGYLCQVKADRLFVERPKGWKSLHVWSKKTATGARSEVPATPDELWSRLSWDESLPCDTCRLRGTCHVTAARRQYRETADLVITDHRLFARDLLTRAERTDAGQLPLLPAYAAAVLDEGHRMPDTWQRAQGHQLSAGLLTGTLDLIAQFAATPARPGTVAAAREAGRQRLGGLLVGQALAAGEELLAVARGSAAGAEEGRRHIDRAATTAAAGSLVDALEAIQADLATDEAMLEGTQTEVTLRAYQNRLDEIIAALTLAQSDQAVVWLEGDDLWAVPRQPTPLHAAQPMPLIFSSATLESPYAAQVLGLSRFREARVGVPFQLAQQVLVYQPPDAADELAGVRAIMQAMRGRTLVLLDSMAEVHRYREALSLPWRLLAEGEMERGAMLEAFRADIASVLVGATLWEGVDVPGEALSCVVIPRLPFPPHDPLILERRAQALARGEDPFTAVDLPEMLLKLKQGMGRLIRTAADRGVLALLDRSYVDQPWAGAVEAVLPEGAERTGDPGRVAAFCPPA